MLCIMCLIMDVNFVVVCSSFFLCYVTKLLVVCLPLELLFLMMTIIFLSFFFFFADFSCEKNFLAKETKNPYDDDYEQRKKSSSEGFLPFFTLLLSVITADTKILYYNSNEKKGNGGEAETARDTRIIFSIER